MYTEEIINTLSLLLLNSYLLKPSTNWNCSPCLHLPFRRKLPFFLPTKVLFGIKPRKQLSDVLWANKHFSSIFLKHWQKEHCI